MISVDEDSPAGVITFQRKQARFGRAPLSGTFCLLDRLQQIGSSVLLDSWPTDTHLPCLSYSLSFYSAGMRTREKEKKISLTEPVIF